MKPRIPLFFSLCALAAPLSCGGTRADGPSDGAGLTSGQTESVGQVEQALEVIPPQLKPLAEAAGNLSTVYGGIQSGIKMLELLGVLDAPPTVQEELQALHQTLLSVAGSAEVIDHGHWVSQVLSPAVNVVHNIHIFAELCGNWATFNANADWCRREMLTCTNPDECAVNGLITVTQADPTWQAFIQARENNMFLRRYQDSGAPTELKPVRAADGLNMHDWRLGIIELMHSISYRMIAISAIRPTWRQTNEPWIRDELTQFRDALQVQYDKMVGPIQCKVTNECSKSCTILGLPIAGCSPNYQVNCYDRQTANRRYHYIDYCDENPNDYTQWFSSEIAQATPFFEVKKMIDTLTFYLTNAPDLTGSNERVRSASAPNLCVDVQWGATSEGAPLWLWPCTGNYAQHFKYERSSGLIYNPSIGTCVDVQWGDPRVGTPIWQWGCIGTNAQRWSYNPETKLLTSALSPRLVLSSTLAQQGMVTLGQWLGPEFGASQFWAPN